MSLMMNGLSSVALFFFMGASTAFSQGASVTEALAFLIPRQQEEPKHKDFNCLKEKRPDLKGISYWNIRLYLATELQEGEPEPAIDTKNYTIFNVMQNKIVPIQDACVHPDVPTEVQLLVNIDDLASTDFYFIHIRKLALAGQAIKKPIGLQLGFAKVSSSQQNTGPTNVYEKPKGRDDANIYIAGAIQRSSGSDLIGSADVKLSYPFLRDFWGSGQIFIPFFDLKGSSDPKADNDTVKIGLDWQYITGIKLRPITSGLNWTNGFAFESNRDFKNTNFIYKTNFRFLYFLPRELTMRGFSMEFNSDLGLETGKNLKSVITAAEGSTIFRPYVGGNLYISIPFGEASDRGMTFFANYIRRFPLKREVTFDVDKDKKPFLVSFGTSPREHVEAALEFATSKFFGAFVGYEYGQLPPLYRLVNHSLKVGFTYQLKILPK